MSCTLRRGSSSTSWVLTRYTSATSATNLRRTSGIWGNTCAFLSDATKSARAFSTFFTKAWFAVTRQNETRSGFHVTEFMPPARVLSEMPRASASRALRFATKHASWHLRTRDAPQGAGCVIRPQAQVTVITTGHGSVSVEGHAEGAWQGMGHGWPHPFLDFPHT